MKKILLVLSLVPTMALSFTEDQAELFRQKNIKQLEKMGMVTPDSGVQLVPRSSLKLKEWQKRKDLLASKQQNKLGYVKEDSPRAIELLNFDEVIKKNAAIEAKMYKPSDSHLRKTTEEMVMAYTFTGVPPSEMNEYIGIAPSGTFVQKPVAGWSGAVQFFRNQIGTCAYTENNLRISHGAARVAEEDASTDINGKVTLVFVTGTDASGFLYRIKWFDNHFIRELECAHKKFSKEMIHSVIALAKKIDSN